MPTHLSNSIIKVLQVTLGTRLNLKPIEVFIPNDTARCWCRKMSTKNQGIFTVLIHERCAAEFCDIRLYICDILPGRPGELHRMVADLAIQSAH